MKNTAYEVEKKLRNICFLVKIEGRKVLKNFDISTAQFDLLQILYFKDRKKLSDISKILGVTKSTTTGLIQRLELMSLLTKEQSEKDKRVFEVVITEEGRKIIDQVLNRRLELINKVIEKMGKDEELIEKLTELYQTIEEVVKSDE
jgi:DNA-binding MarR family transcriptional regulator